MRSDGASDRDDHDESGFDRADVVQSGGGRDCQGASGARDRCAGRRDGRSHRCRGDSIPVIEYEPRSGGMVAARAVRQEAIPGSYEGGAGTGAELADSAG